jgi:hypothetical protein
VSFLERLQSAAKTHEPLFAECYAEANGRPLRARLKLGKRLFAAFQSEGSYALDPATIAMIFALLKLAIEVWKWAKDNGYLKSYAYQEAPMQAMLLRAYNAGEYPETMAGLAMLSDMLDDATDENDDE